MRSLLEMIQKSQKTYLLVLTLLVILSFTNLIANSGPLVTWYDVQSGFANARRLNRWVVADIYTNWCGWCKRMERETFEDPTVEEMLSQSFVCIRVNAEDKGLGERLAKDCQVTGFPTIVIFDPEGKPKARHTGYLTASQFMKVMSNFKQANNIR
jgi:uncharacterized protein YyaL (SSP411 family)